MGTSPPIWYAERCTGTISNWSCDYRRRWSNWILPAIFLNPVQKRTGTVPARLPVRPRTTYALGIIIHISFSSSRHRRSKRNVAFLSISKAWRGVLSRRRWPGFGNWLVSFNIYYTLYLFCSRCLVPWLSDKQFRILDGDEFRYTGQAFSNWIYNMASRGVKHPTYIVRSRNVYRVHITVASKPRTKSCGFLSTVAHLTILNNSMKTSTHTPRESTSRLLF